MLWTSSALVGHDLRDNRLQNVSKTVADSKELETTRLVTESLIVEPLTDDGRAPSVC